MFIILSFVEEFNINYIIVSIFIKELTMNSQFIIDESGVKKAIILPIEDYEELLEDIHDLTVIAERKDEPSISPEELKKKLNTDGLIQN